MKQSNFRLNRPVRRSKKKPVILGVAAAILLVGVGGFALYKYMQKPATDPNATDPTINTAKDDAGKTSNNNVDDGTPNNSTTEQIPQSQNLSLKITDYSQSGGMVKSSASISGTNSAGNCVFTFTSTDSRPVVEQASSSDQAGSQVCSVNISEVRFDKIGSWNLDVTFFQNNTKTSASRQVTVN